LQVLGETAAGQALLRRALLLLGQGELQELHEMRALLHDTRGICDFIVSMLAHDGSTVRHFGGFSCKRVDAPRDAPVSRALESLRVVQGKHVTVPVALIQHCAATLTELDCFKLGDDSAVDSVLPRCTRLESLPLSDWTDCPPAAWLGLSQLHTLRGVSLSVVPAAAIAAALPRLHTLHLNHQYEESGFSVDARTARMLIRRMSRRHSFACRR
jgi:hypothetical protein